MKVLFDHNVPRKLRRRLAGFEIVTAEEMGWAELVNGRLLRAAEDAGFGLMRTTDQSIAYQQNLIGRKLALIVLSTNDWRQIQGNVMRIAAALAQATLGSYQSVTIENADR